MKHIPILFSTEMVQAIIDGRKTQTRREIKQAIGYDPIWKPTLIKEEHLDGIPRYEMRTGTQYSLPWFKCPYGQPGDVLWVREKFETETDGHVKYYADNISVEHNPAYRQLTKWKPSIHMPKTACRIWLQVVSVKAERLQDISEYDAIAEGVLIWEHKYGATYFNYLNENFSCNALESFSTLWQSINGEQSWKDNPWVWRIEFKRIEKHENFI